MIVKLNKVDIAMKLANNFNTTVMYDEYESDSTEYSIGCVTDGRIKFEVKLYEGSDGYEHLYNETT